MERFIKKMKRNVDIICFPEFATTGYSLGSKWRKLAEPIPGTTTRRLFSLAREHGHYIIAGLPELDIATGNVYDTSAFVSPTDEKIEVYRKVHLWGKERQYLTHGTQLPMFETRFGKLGMGICYDLEFPEHARALTIGGADVIFFPSAQMKPLKDMIIRYVQTRAVENQVFVALANRIGTEGTTAFFGASRISSPEGQILAACAEKEDMAIAKLDIKSLRSRRKKFPYIKHRIPSLYRSLSE